ncbi:superoxide dismutase family protein [Sphingomonas jaspsi]|uniref:superoxide dismutase family protein n=1 Tax=Sphingomonas jaspsi TaxID=392409 RepID=UPI0004AE823A|nr:superoxide dismutase family protein [Sphingomonas jaspsi]
MHKLMTIMPLAALLVAGCATAPHLTPGTTRSLLIDTRGVEIGYVDSWEAQGRSQIALHLRPGFVSGGNHGMHFHEIGRCDPPDFKSAGGHWNPTHMKHGQLSPGGGHVGDWGNLIVFTDKETQAGLVNSLPYSFKDADGTSLVIHADADDLKTDPSGNSGARVACAVLAPPQ